MREPEVQVVRCTVVRFLDIDVLVKGDSCHDDSFYRRDSTTIHDYYDNFSQLD